MRVRREGASTAGAWDPLAGGHPARSPHLSRPRARIARPCSPTGIGPCTPGVRRRRRRQAQGIIGEESWTPQRRFERVFERLALPGFRAHGPLRAARHARSPRAVRAGGRLAASGCRARPGRPRGPHDRRRQAHPRGRRSDLPGAPRGRVRAGAVRSRSTCSTWRSPTGALASAPRSGSGPTRSTLTRTSASARRSVSHRSPTDATSPRASHRCPGGSGGGHSARGTLNAKMPSTPAPTVCVNAALLHRASGRDSCDRRVGRP